VTLLDRQPHVPLFLQHLVYSGPGQRFVHGPNMQASAPPASIDAAWQLPLMHAPPTALQFWQVAPFTPHAVSDPPMLQAPFKSMQPVQVTGFEGALHIVMGIGIGIGSGPQVSPRVRHSAADAQSWSGPIGLDGQGPNWQAVVIVVNAPQHT
jgi:hypothetical protein